MTYGVELAAHGAVVATVLAEAAAAGATIGDATRAAWERLEAHLRGEPVTAAELERAAAAAHDEGTRLFRIKLTGDAWLPVRSAAWAATAVGNLCVMALRGRGWQQVERTVMDAATSALAPADASARLQGVRSKVRARPPAGAGRLARPSAAPRPRPRRLPDAYARRVGAVAFAELRRARAVIDPGARFDEAALRARLAEHGYKAHAPAVAFEAIWGGLAFSDPFDPDRRWTVGAGACAPSKEHGGAPGPRKGLVPVALTANDVYYFLARDGSGWAQDGIEEGEASPFARDAGCLMARIALFQVVHARRMRNRVIDLPGIRGAAIARTLRLAAIPQATDHLARAWGSATALVIEHQLSQEPGIHTIVAVARKSLLPRP